MASSESACRRDRWRRCGGRGCHPGGSLRSARSSGASRTRPAACSGGIPRSRRRRRPCSARSDRRARRRTGCDSAAASCRRAAGSSCSAFSAGRGRLRSGAMHLIRAAAVRHLIVAPADRPNSSLWLFVTTRNSPTASGAGCMTWFENPGCWCRRRCCRHHRSGSC